MLQSDHPIRPIAAAIGLCIAPVAGLTATLLIYLLVAAVAAASCLRHPRNSPFFWFGLATLSFAAARTSGVIGEADNPVELASDFLAYLLLLIGAVRLFRGRIQSIEPETVLEMLGLGSLLVLLATGASALDIAPSTTAALTVVASVGSGAVVVSALFGRRSHPVMRNLMLAALVAVVVEILFWNVTNRAVGLGAAALPYIPLTLSARSDHELTVDQLSVRRNFGKRQLGALAAMMVLPTLVLMQLILVDQTGPMPVVVSAGVFGSLVMAVRILLVVQLRDWSFEREREIRSFGERLVSAKNVDETVAAAVEVMDRLTGGTAMVGVVLLDGNKGTIVESRGRIPAASTKGSTDSHTDYGTRNRNNLPASLSSIASVRSIIVTDVPGPNRYLLFAAADRPFRPELEGLFSEVANHLAIVLETASLREEIHKERANRQFKALAQDSNDLVLVVDPESLETRLVGPTIERLLGYKESEYLNQKALQHMAEEDLAVAKRTLQAAMDRKQATHCDVRVCRSDGSNNWFGMSARPLDADSEIQGLLVSFTNIHDRKMAEFLVRQAESRYRALVQKSTDIFVLVTKELTIDYISPNVQNLIGYPAEDLLGARLPGLLTGGSAETLTELFSQDLRELDGSNIELHIRTASRSSIVAEVALTDPELSDHEGLLLIMRDVTAQRHLEDSLRNRATHDQLTGLLNRPSFEHALDGALKRLNGGLRLGVIALDIKHFREINDSAGYAIGNQILIEVGNRLRSALREQDSLGRLVADEFVILARDATEAGLMAFARRVETLFEDPFFLAGRARKLDVAIGMATTDDNTEEARDVVQAAIVAVHQAKTREAPEIVLYEQSLQDEVDERFELMTDMQSALDSNQFSLVFQPLISLETQQVHSFEALLRWAHPTRGNISPATFIPLAERSGMIVEIGRWVLDQACRQIVKWQRELDGFPNASVAVNLSARQLERDGELQTLLAIIEASGVDCSALSFELTESIMLKDASWIRNQLTQLREMGIEIAIDDFGTGASGLNHLRELPFDIVKIDKSYVDKVGADRDGENLVSQIIDLAQGLDARTVAEGIETPAQADWLTRSGCDIGQGFYLAKPMDPERIESWLQVRRRAELPAFSLDR